MSSEKPDPNMHRSFEIGDAVLVSREALLNSLVQDPEIVAYYELWILSKTSAVDEELQQQLRLIKPSLFNIGFAFKWDLSLREVTDIRDKCIANIVYADPDLGYGQA